MITRVFNKTQIKPIQTLFPGMSGLLNKLCRHLKQHTPDTSVHRDPMEASSEMDTLTRTIKHHLTIRPVQPSGSHARGGFWINCSQLLKNLRNHCKEFGLLSFACLLLLTLFMAESAVAVFSSAITSGPTALLNSPKCGPWFSDPLKDPSGSSQLS
jgi:hypothetical protein